MVVTGVGSTIGFASVGGVVPRWLTRVTAAMAAWVCDRVLLIFGEGENLINQIQSKLF